LRFIPYFELNPDFDPSDLANFGMNLMEKKLYPAKGIETIAWYISTGYWGISITEAESVEGSTFPIRLVLIELSYLYKSVKY
jgi:hypothetical protein